MGNPLSYEKSSCQKLTWGAKVFCLSACRVQSKGSQTGTQGNVSNSQNSVSVGKKNNYICLQCFNEEAWMAVN